MDPTYFGIDIILYPKGMRGKTLQEQGRVIEINGANSGSSFYKMGETGFYRRAARWMAQRGTVLLPYDITSEFMREQTEANRSATSEVSQCAHTTIDMHAQLQDEHPCTNFHIFHDYSIDSVRSRTRDPHAYSSSKSLPFLRALREQGLAHKTYDSFTVANGVLRITRSVVPDDVLAAYPEQPIDEPRRVWPISESFPYWCEVEHIAVADIGLVFSSLNRGCERELGRERIVNGTYLDDLSFQKDIQQFSGALFGLDSGLNYGLADMLPSGILIGGGMHTPDAVATFVRQHGELFVTKPLDGSQGTGVRIRDANEVLAMARQVFYDPSPAARARAYADHLVSFSLGKQPTVAGVLLAQPLIPSTLVSHPSGSSYPACARAIVGDGAFLGAAWRSSCNDEGSLTDRLVHNVGRGAAYLPIEDQDLPVI
ncbi:hypothetical protein COY28_03865, partial [Candidatus Woesearchaeota archaeon CG_4_10_14_0_2_um_filter_57_5]